MVLGSRWFRYVVGPRHAPHRVVPFDFGGGGHPPPVAHGAVAPRTQVGGLVEPATDVDGAGQDLTDPARAGPSNPIPGQGKQDSVG